MSEKTRANAVITVHKYEPETYDQPAQGPALVRIHVEESFSGDISGEGAVEFFVSFLGGAAFGFVAGRLMLSLVGWTRDNPQAEATLTLVVWPVWLSRTNTSSLPFVSPATRFVAAELKTR